MSIARGLGLAAALWLAGCTQPPSELAHFNRPEPVGSLQQRARPTAVPVVVKSLPVAGDQPAFALRGVKADAHNVGIVLHGWCGHGLGLLQAYQFAAAEVGPFLALQGDLHCGAGALRGWTLDPERIDARIDRALVEYLPDERPQEILLQASSQGVDVAVALARAYPDKYTRLVLLSAFKQLSPLGLGKLKGAHFLVGQYEDQWPTRLSVERWQQAGIQATMEVISAGGHSDLHGEGNALMRRAFGKLGVKIDST